METGYSGAGGYYVDTLGKNANRVFRRTPGNSLLGVIRKSTGYAGGYLLIWLDINEITNK